MCHTTSTHRHQQEYTQRMKCTLPLKYVYYLLLRYNPSPYMTGHPGYTGMQWHQKNAIGANYTDKDAASARGICQRYVLGSAHQYPTNQHYVRSDTSYDPGQEFVVDAFTHHSIGAGGFVYAHLFTDLAFRQVYPVFIKFKLVVELTEMMSKLFFAHPEWKPNGTAIDRKIKVDMETGYQSEDFKEYCHSLRYRDFSHKRQTRPWCRREVCWEYRHQGQHRNDGKHQ